MKVNFKLKKKYLELLKHIYKSPFQGLLMKTLHILRTN